MGRALDPDDLMSGAVGAVSFDDTIGEIKRVVEEDLSEDPTVQSKCMKCYECFPPMGEADKSCRVPIVEDRESRQ